MSQALTHWLEAIGLNNHQQIFYNLDRAQLVTHAILEGEGSLTHSGAFNVDTSPYTGRSPNDKFLVKRKTDRDIWWGSVNQSLEPSSFDALRKALINYLRNRPLYVTDCAVGSDPSYRYNIRILTEYAWQALASQNLFIYNGAPHADDPDITLLAAPGLNASPDIPGFNSSAGIVLDIEQKTILIAGSKYFGEIKKSVFSLMNALLPERLVFPMHCAATVGEQGDTALYFGLSGTGKTTLSSTPERRLIGDDEHGWGEQGIYNFEGGCYAKTIRLDPKLEPVIWQAVNQFGTVLENVIINPATGEPVFADSEITENTRAAYSISQVKNVVPSGTGTHPDHIFFLTADAFGVLPPIARLSLEEAIFYFIIGYTSKVAGTERGLGKKPVTTFSTCFAEPFLPLKPMIYADMLTQKIKTHGSQVWLVNTGWTGGDFNTGYRMPLPYTRRMVDWILSGEHITSTYHRDEIFHLSVPDEIPTIPSDLLYPQRTWQDEHQFTETAQHLKAEFSQQYEHMIKEI